MTKKFLLLFFLLTGFFVSTNPQSLNLFAAGDDKDTTADTKEMASSEDRPRINENPLSAGGRVIPHQILPGANGELVLNMNLAKKHHAYLNRFKLKVVSPAGVKVSQPDITPVIEFKDKLSKSVKKGIAGAADLRAILEIPENYQGKFQDKMKLILTYQACTDDYCLLPVHLPIEFPFSSAKEEIAGGTHHQVSTGVQGPFAKALDKGWLYLFIFVFFAGVLTSFTPCIYPMIPITLAVLGARDDHSSRKKGFLLSLMYVFGIALTYATLGLIAASTGGLFGSLLGHPVAVSIIATIFVLMGLSMFGLFEIKLPNSVAQKLTETPKKKGYIGACLTGMVAGVVASPCVGPVLANILTLVATSQDLVFGFFLLFTFAMGLGQIFILLGTFSSFASRLPRSGPWMNSVKFIFGSVMVGMAIYYLEVIVPPWVTKSLIAIALILIAFFHGAFQSFKDANPLKLAQRSLMWVLLVVGVYNASLAFRSFLEMNKNKMAHHHEHNSHHSPKQGPPWQVFSDQLLQKAKMTGHPVILDIYADWCSACKELDHLTFSDPKILAATKTFYWLQFDATESSPEFKKLRETYKIQGLPTVLLFDSNGVWIKNLTLTGFEDVPAFADRLERLLKAH